MNWFKKHLNWTYGLGGGALFFGIGVTLRVIELEPVVIPLIIWFFGMAGLIWLSRWVLKEKNRPLWIAIFAPFFIGWLYILCCYNRSEEVLVARDNYLGDISMKVKYFAYGSNMVTERLQAPERAPSAKPMGRAKLPDKSLVCNKKSDDGSGKANLVDSDGNTVWGVLYEIDSTQLKKLDDCEKGYKNICLDVLTERDLVVSAHVYISSELTDDPRPYDWYKELMVKGAIEHQLPTCYIELLKQIESKPDPRCAVKCL